MGKYVGVPRAKGRKILIITSVLTLVFVMMSGTISYSLFFSDNIKQEVNGEEPVPSILKENDLPEPKVAADGDFIISYEDDVPGFDALYPSIAVSPPPSSYANSIHAVWQEVDETMGVEAIHYSMSRPEDKGREWSNDEESEGDRIISDDFYGWPAFNPSIAIEDYGPIHVLYCQEYNDGGPWPTYEIHQISSMDNGQSWSPSHLVSYKNVDPLMNSNNLLYPKLAISNNYQGDTILHAVWSEFNMMLGQQEIYYSRSVDGGISWSGEQFDLPPISSVSSPDMAGDPTISVGGADSDVHVAWSQNSQASMVPEVFYTRCTDAGTGGIWEPERPISSESDTHWPGPPKIASNGNDVFAVWNQPSNQDGNYEVILSASTNAGGGSWTPEAAISFDDDNDVDWDSLDIVTAPNGAVFTTWTEWDMDSSEIHYSMSDTPTVPNSWSGHDRDIVLSHPDNQDAMSPALALSNFDGRWQPQLIWSEFNASGAGKVNQNTEIHYIQNTTFDIPVHLGWNLISVPLKQNDTGILTVLDDSAGDGLTTWDMVRYYDRSGGTDQWKTYGTFMPSALNTLANINHTMGFWISITAIGDGNLTIYGDYDTSTVITLKAGWNHVGYPAQTSKSVTNSFAGVSGFTSAEGYNASATYKISQLAGSYMMLPGEGYWVKVSSDTTWTINW